jgi:hypothetical protein
MSSDDTGTVTGGGVGGGGGGDHDGEGLAQRLIGEIAQVRAELARAHAGLDRLERRRAVERAVIDAQARDVQAAADAAEQRLGSAPGADVTAVVRALRRDRPGLFAPGAHGAGAERGEQAELARLRAAAASGDRASLLLYLRARRSKQ